MNKFYAQLLLSFGLFCFLPGLFGKSNALAQSTDRRENITRSDLLENINRVNRDEARVGMIEQKIKEAKAEENKKALKVHRKKLKLEKEILKKDSRKMRDEEDLYTQNQEDKIKNLKMEVLQSRDYYELARKKLKKDLDAHNDWSLKKGVNELMQAQEKLREDELALATETSEFRSTRDAVEKEFRKLKESKKINYSEPAGKSNQKNLAKE